MTEIERIASLSQQYMTTDKSAEFFRRISMEITKDGDDPAAHEMFAKIAASMMGKQISENKPLTNFDKSYYTFMVYFYVTTHIAIIVFNLIAFFVLLYESFAGRVPWYVAMPCCCIIFYLGTARVECPSTRFENDVRRRLGWRPVSGFFGHYFLKMPKKIISKLTGA